MIARKRNIQNKENTISDDAIKDTTSTTETKTEENKVTTNSKHLKILLVFITIFLTIVGSSFVSFIKHYRPDLYSKKVKVLLPSLFSKTEDYFIFSNVENTGLFHVFYEDSTFNIVKNFFDHSKQSCLHRKLVVDKHGKQRDLVKTDHKCINGMFNEWHIERRGKFHAIISDYDRKCLNYSKDGSLHMKECKKNNKYENFIIKDDGIDCSKLGATNCLDFSFISTPAMPKKYKNLPCSWNFANLGIKCCSKDAKTEYVDYLGNWGIENGKLCGIGYTRCSFETIGYPCCTSLNPEVVSTDENGSWGYEDGEKCGIGDLKTKYRFRNKKTSECLVTNKFDTDKIRLGDCDDIDNSTWYIKDNKIVSFANDKCLYINNSNDPALTECKEVKDQTGHHEYIEINFNIHDTSSIVNNIFTICFTNDIEQKQLCLNSKNLKFEESKDEHSDWIIESLNSKIIFFIDSIISKNPNLIKKNNS